jgi:hypothetical protein
LITSHVGVKPVKQINYRVTCRAAAGASAGGNSTIPETPFQPGPISNPTASVVSQTCTFMIGIVGTTDGIIHYELSVEEETDTHVTNLNHFTYVK